MNPTSSPRQENDLVAGGFSPEEEAQFREKINAVRQANRLVADPAAFRPRKRGILFPVTVNLAAILLVTGAWFGFNAYFQTQQEGLKLKTDKMFSTESKLLTKVLEDSKNQLAAKNAEIEKIQGDMAKLATEKADLQKSFADRVSAQERSLRKELADALAVEKKRLQDAGYGASEIAQRLKDFEAQKNAEFNNRLDAYRRQVQGEIDQRSQAVVALQAKLQASAAEQERLRKEIETQTKERERDLQSQLTTQAADLDVLKKEKEDLTLFYRQADAAMASVRTAFDSGDLAATQAAVLALRQVLAKATASASAAVRSRAQAEASIAATLDSAVTGLGAASSKVASSQLDAVKAQAKKEQELAALQLKETQATLAAAEARFRQAAAEAEALRQAVDKTTSDLRDSRVETLDARMQVDALDGKVSDLQKTVEELIPYKARFQTLKGLFTQNYATAKDRFVATFGSPEGREQFPQFDESWTQLSGQFQGEGTSATARKQALDDVLTFTDYLQGLSASGQAARDNAEKLTRSDATYKKVVEGIQALVASGAKEAAVSTMKTQLYGTVASVSGTKVVLEPLTKVRPQEGQEVELRRVKGKKESLLGTGKVLTATNLKVELDWTGNEAVPLSGDPAYLVLP